MLITNVIVPYFDTLIQNIFKDVYCLDMLHNTIILLQTKNAKWGTNNADNTHLIITYAKEI